MRGRTAAPALALLIMGCQPPPIIMTIDPADPRFAIQLLQDWGLVFRDRKVPCVNEVILAEGDTVSEADRRTPVWRLTATGSLQCRDLPRVILGDVPAGFAQEAPLPPRLSGRYTLMVGGIGDGRLVVELSPPPSIRYKVSAVADAR